MTVSGNSKAVTINGTPVMYPNRMIFWHKGLIKSFAPAPTRLLTSDPVVVENELTMTKKTVEMLRMMVAIASCVSAKMFDRDKEKEPGASADKGVLSSIAER